MKILYKVVIILLIIASLSTIFSAIIEGNNMPYNPGYNANDGMTELTSMGNSLMGTFTYIVQVLCVVTIIIMGLRYMFASADTRADIKKGIVVWTVGAVIVFSATSIIGIVLEVVTGDKNVINITPPEENHDNQDGTNPSDWAQEEWDKAKQANLIPGSIENKAGDDITRGEFSEVVYYLADALNVRNITDFAHDGKDVEELTRNQIIDILHRAGVLEGTGTRDDVITYDEELKITRQDVATMLYRFFGEPDKEKYQEEFDLLPYEEKEKYSQVKDYAKVAMYYMNQKGIIKGDENGNLNPLGTTTCQEAVIISYRLYED